VALSGHDDGVSIAQLEAAAVVERNLSSRKATVTGDAPETACHGWSAFTTHKGDEGDQDPESEIG